MSKSNRFGLVLQNADISLDDDTVLDRNSERDKYVGGGDLPVPNNPVALP